MGVRLGRGGGSAHRYAVIMAGGIGSRFWPHSRRRRPKQFLTVQGERSLLEDTVLRLRGVVDEANILVVAGPEFRALIRRHLPRLPAENLVVEPAARGTAACLGLAARVIERRDPEGVMAVFPADHVIAPLSSFQRSVRVAFATAESERCLVTFGIQPTGPETGFGYIEIGAAQRRTRPRVHWANRFVEKPDRETARRYLRKGNYRWNSGMFVWRVDVLRDALARHEPPVADALDAMDLAARRGRGAARARRQFAALRAVAIDVAVMEKADRVAVVEGDFAWNDVGSWAAMEGLWPMDDHRNSARGSVLQIDCRDTIASSDGRLLAMVGVEDLIVVESRDAILVCPKSRAQDVRRIVDALARRGGGRYL
jgi:mannose-1-phosphate guanylyltransferase